jgi:hypothetical protein
MDIYSAEQTPKTPFLNFDPNTGVFEMKGKSIPENSVLFYKGVYEWMDKYFETPAKTTTLNVSFDYFNTSSAKCIVDMFKKLEAFGKKGHEVAINWMYNEADDDMKEAGEDYQSIIKIPFNLQSYVK